jgi:hypothetical protein
MRHYQAERTRVVEMKCVSHDCGERNIVKELRALEELGGLFLTTSTAASAARKWSASLS